MIAVTTLAPTGRMAILILGLLLLASAVLATLRRARPGTDWSELGARLRSWWIMTGLFFAALALTDRVTLLFFAVLSFLALKEYVTLLDFRRADHAALVLAFAAVPLQYLWIALGSEALFALFIPVCVFLALPAYLALSGEPGGFLASTSRIQWGLMAFVFGLSHLGYLLTLPGRGPVRGPSLVLFLVFVVELSDVLQYVWGKLAGRHPILPRVSPNKTWEGFLGGVACASLAGTAVGFLTPFSRLEALGVSLLLTTAGFVGGALMSACKRDLGVKDFGHLIPGHGGVLDRVDSLCYAGPIFAYYVRHWVA